MKIKSPLEVVIHSMLVRLTDFELTTNDDKLLDTLEKLRQLLVEFKENNR